MLACKLWELRATDIMQGVVYGTRTDSINDERLLTRFDFDEAFGTVINRYCAQAVIGHPLTPYGKGGAEKGFHSSKGLPSVPDYCHRKSTRRR
jgi:UDP-sulfoquinovose synthase